MTILTAQVGMFLFDFALDVSLFVATTTALLASSTDPLQRLLHVLPIGAKNQVCVWEGGGGEGGGCDFMCLDSARKRCSMLCLPLSHQVPSGRVLHA